MKQLKHGFLLAATLALGVSAAHAEVSELRIAQQYGISYLPLMVMEEQKLIEKRAKEAGIPDLKLTWAKFAGGNVMNDGLLSNSLDIASGGICCAQCALIFAIRPS